MVWSVRQHLSENSLEVRVPSNQNIRLRQTCVLSPSPSWVLLLPGVFESCYGGELNLSSLQGLDKPSAPIRTARRVSKLRTDEKDKSCSS